MKHHVPASSKTCAWGYFDASREPVITVQSGDIVVMDTVSGVPEVLPEKGFQILPEHLEVHENCRPTMQGHILTGPIAVQGAKPGQTLQVDVLEVELLQDWGYNMIRPLAGTLPYDFDQARTITIPLDKEANTATLPWGLKLPLAPFFGVMGVAPPPNWGRITSIMPRAHAGNIDNKELVAGTTLYLPIFNEGGLFSCGDGHGAQGDGEVCLTAIETALRGTFRLTLREDMGLAYPRAETPTHYITMGMDPDLDQCVVLALRDMIELLQEKADLSREDAYTLCSLAGDLRITQTVNNCKGVHMMIAKSLLHAG